MQKTGITDLAIDKYQWNYFLVLFILFAAVFEAHIVKLVGVSTFPLVEGLIVLLFLLTLVNYLIRGSLLKVEVHIFLFALLLFVTGLFKQELLPLVLGIFFICKPFLAFICGLHFPLRDEDLQKIFKLIGLLALFSIAISFLQYLGFGLNPFEFNLNSSGIIGILDNPNKNAQLMVYGYLIFSNMPKSNLKKLLIPTFFLGVLLTGSRQGLVFFLLILFVQEIVLKKRWHLVLTTIPFLVAFLIYFADTLLFRFFALLERIDSGEYFRLKALNRSLELLWENPVFGNGPGTFGGIVAYWNDSPVQRELWLHWENYRFFPKTVDIYLPHLWAEIGILGVLYFVFIMYLMVKPFYKAKAQFSSSTSLLFLALAIFLFSITSMSLEASFFNIIIFFLLGAMYRNINRSYSSEI